MGLYKLAIDKHAAHNFGMQKHARSGLWKAAQGMTSNNNNNNNNNNNKMKDDAAPGDSLEWPKDPLGVAGYAPYPSGNAMIGTVRDISTPTGKYPYISRQSIPKSVAHSVITPRSIFKPYIRTMKRQHKGADISDNFVPMDLLLAARRRQAGAHALEWSRLGTDFYNTVDQAMRESGAWWQHQMRRGQFDPKANAPMPDYLKNHKQYQMLSPEEKELMQLQMNNMVYNNNESTGYLHA